MNKKFEPLVSIIIPVYNGEKYLSEAIDSALNQTYKNIEIIVVNDGSKDNTEEVALSYGNKIQYFGKENGGASTALNLGIKHMKGEYFSWLSHDDMYYPKKIERQIQELAKLDNKNTIMMTDLDGIDENYKKIYETKYINHIKAHAPRENFALHPIIYNQTHGCTLLIPKVSFTEVGLFDETQRVAQDFEYFYRAFLKYPHKLIPEVLVTARDSSNRMGRRFRGSVEYSNLFIKMIEEFTEEEFKLLAPTKLEFYHDMIEFFDAAGYYEAYDYIVRRAVKNLQISSYDLIGNKFNGHDLHLYLRDKEIDSEQLVLYKDSKDVNTHVFNFNEGSNTKNLLRERIFIDTGLVHLHLVHNIMDLNYLPMISRLKPTIITLHDPFFFAGHCVHHFDCDKWQTICEDCPYLKEPFALDTDYSALNFGLKKAAIQNSKITAIVSSDWMMDKYQKSPIWKDKKIYKVPFGINQEIFKPMKNDEARAALNISKDDFVIFFRSEDNSFKGLDVIKRALDNISTKKNITILTVGQKNNLNEYKNKYNIIEFGWIKEDRKLVNLYTACDIFLMPSKQESFGLMAIEAMSCGKTVLAIDADGSAISNTINSPEAGVAVVEKEYTRTLEKFINDSELLIKHNKLCLDYATKNHSKEKYISRMIDIYKETMDSFKIDDEAEIILEQLRRYKSPILVIDSRIEQGQTSTPNYSGKKGSIIRRTYHKLPIHMRRNIKGIVIKIGKVTSKVLPKKYLLKIRNKLFES